MLQTKSLKDKNYQQSLKKRQPEGYISMNKTDFISNNLPRQFEAQ